MPSRFQRTIVGLTAATLFAGVASAVPARASDLSIRFAWYMPPKTATADQGEAIAKNIADMSNGSIDVSTYPSGSLAKESTMAQALANNTANMGIMAMHWWSSMEPSLEWDTIPFLADDAGQLLDALHGKLGDDINKIFNKHGVQIVGWGYYGYAESYVNTKHPIKTPDDLDGLRMRSEGSLSAEFLKAKGASPVAVDSSEVYTALQRGTLDGAVSGLSSIVSRKWYEVGHNITAIHYVPLVYPVQVNLGWWQGLTDEQRDIISKAVAKTEKPNVDAIEKEFKDDIELAKKAGDDVYVPTEDDLAKWKDATLDMALKSYYAKAGDTGKSLVADVQSAMGGKATQ
ncbi:hypothetical protein E3C22_09010 [Jiella endophytica]|uniref:TRAP transporter substrate-binding protein n=1 Tax=Jiella endophytica TaxID=2558362 RepID=A0A4Y8RPD5_9HYPH|nr:TRAP transporter substrate-binding protein DctP [Jiella endophytica]TFF25478.1 hypothetical protein E3C22_09010 [Jiella endophytica]